MKQRNSIAAFVVGLILLISMPCAAEAADYYVSPSGNDSNPGTLASPWRTLKKALDTVKGGDTAHFRAGVYASAHAPWDMHPPAGQWITFKPYQNEKVTINTAGGPWSFHGVSYVIIEGFEITNLSYRHNLPHSCDVYTPSCRALAETLGNNKVGLNFFSTVIPKGYTKANARTVSHHVIVRNNEIHHNEEDGLTGAGQSSYNFQILNNHIHHNGYAGLAEGYGTYISGTNWIVRGNRVHHNSGNNLRIGNIVDGYKAIGWIIENNLLYNAQGPFHHASGNIRDDSLNLALYGTAGSIVRNNIFYGSFGSGMWAVNIDPSKPDLIYNNTFYGNGKDGLRISQGPIMARNNISWGNGTRMPSYQLEMTGTHTGVAEKNLVGGGSLLIRNTGSGTERNNIRNADPKFVNAAGGDFHVQAGSPAIDAGMTLAEVVEDFDRGARPAGAAYDIGAFESGALPRICSVPGTAVAVPTSVIDPSTGQPPTRPGYVLLGVVPPGFTLSAGTLDQSVSGGSVYRLTLAQLSGLTLTPPADFKGTVKIEAFFVPQ